MAQTNNSGKTTLYATIVGVVLVVGAVGTWMLHGPGRGSSWKCPPFGPPSPNATCWVKECTECRYRHSSGPTGGDIYTCVGGHWEFHPAVAGRATVCDPTSDFAH